MDLDAVEVDHDPVVAHEQVAWLLEYGATQVADLRDKYGPGTGWVVLADPEGNEFCILRSDAELTG